MTQLLQQALHAVQLLTPAEQDAIAALILDELADDQRWNETFARTQSGLAELAKRARADVSAGRIRGQGIDEL